jgi:hypothetical protein
LANVEVFRIQVLAIIGSLALIVSFSAHPAQRRGGVLLLWLGMGVVFLSSRFRGCSTNSRPVGIGYPPAALFFILIMGLMFILVHFSVAISELKESNKRLAQQLGLLRQEVEEK